ncbi:hypothetical protein QJQ45_017061 [Haematococcus lacustris]|nr:hypothetical protein QJQ45_017061 [Haematococcus lacustris]
MVLNINHDDPLWSFKSQFGVQCSSLRRSAPACSFGTSPGAVHLPLVPSLTPSPQDYKAGFAPVTCNYPNKTMLRWSASNLARSPFPTSSLGGCIVALGTRPAWATAWHTTASCITPQGSGPALQLVTLLLEHGFDARGALRLVASGRVLLLLGLEQPDFSLSCCPAKLRAGPHTVGREAFSSIGQQVSSLRETSPRIAPARAARFMRFRSQEVNATPGPGAYNV